MRKTNVCKPVYKRFPAHTCFLITKIALFNIYQNTKSASILLIITLRYISTISCSSSSAVSEGVVAAGHTCQVAATPGE